MKDKHEPDRMTHSRRPVLFLALGLVLLSALQLAYRATLPTDGWSVTTSDAFNNPDWVYWQNLVGQPSLLMGGDTLIAVGDQSVTGTATLTQLPPPPYWTAGNQAALTISRDGQQQTISVPVVNWNWQAWWKYNIATISQFINLSGVLILFATGLFAFWRRPDIPSAQALLMLCTVFLANAMSGLLPDGLSVQFNQLAYYLTRFFSYMIFGVLLAPLVSTSIGTEKGHRT